MKHKAIKIILEYHHDGIDQIRDEDGEPYQYRALLTKKQVDVLCSSVDWIVTIIDAAYIARAAADDV
jgi:hypothetical protein